MFAAHRSIHFHTHFFFQISVATFHLGQLQLSQQSIGSQACIKLQASSLSGEECPAISWEEFQVNFAKMKIYFLKIHVSFFGHVLDFFWWLFQQLSQCFFFSSLFPHCPMKTLRSKAKVFQQSRFSFIRVSLVYITKYKNIYLCTILYVLHTSSPRIVRMMRPEEKVALCENPTI